MLHDQPQTPALSPARNRSKIYAGLLTLLLITGFFVRAYQPLSRSGVWPTRADNFLSAVRDQNWGATYQSRHPGVTIMAVGALTFAAYDRASDTPFERLFTWGALPNVNAFGLRVAAGLVGISLFLMLLHLALALTLRSIYDWPLALTATALLTFSPFYLTQSRVFHVDAAVATFMILSAALLIGYIERGKLGFLIASGLVGGFAVLSKSPAVFLFPFAGLALLVQALRSVMQERRAGGQLRPGLIVRHMLSDLLRPLAIWTLMFMLPFALWPAMWVTPGASLQMMFSGAAHHVEDAHADSRFFAGEAYWRERPPFTYYATSLLFRSSFITLVFLILTGLMATVWRKHKLLPASTHVVGLMFAYIVFFTAQMAIGAKQVDRYILPAQVMLDMIAAVGIIGFGKLVATALSERPHTRFGPALPAAALILPLILHIVVTLSFFPDYGARYNYLLGNSHTATRFFSFLGQDEGNQYIIDYLMTRPDRDTIWVEDQPELWNQFDVGDAENPTTRLHLVSITDIRRQHLWVADLQKLYGDRKPLITVSFDRVIYLWLFSMDEATQTETIRIARGWAGFTVVAWISTLLLTATLSWALYELERKPPSPT